MTFFRAQCFFRHPSKSLDLLQPLRAFPRKDPSVQHKFRGDKQYFHAFPRIFGLEYAFAHPLPDNDPALRKALARFQADNGMVVTGVVDFATYERALRHFVGLSADGTLARIGWASTHAEPVPQIAASPATPDAAVQVVSTNPGAAKY